MSRPNPIAVVGLGALFPGAPTTAGFWRDLVEGRDRITDVPRTHWLAADYFAPKPGTPDKVYTTRGGFLPEVEFSPLEFGLPPSVLPATDTSQLLALVVAKRVLAEATRGRFERMDRTRMSVILGVASATELVAHMAGRLQLPIVARAMRAAGLAEEDVARVEQTLAGFYTPWQEATFPGLLGNVVAGRVASRLDLGGTNVVVDAACAGSLAAVHSAVSELALGHADLVVTGGVDTLNDILMFMCFAQTGALSLTGDCRAFSEDADGTVLGEGVGLLALRRLEDAERDGDPIYAVLRGVGTSSDGRANSIYAPRAEGQGLALRRAYERAGFGPETVELVEAHGTATRAGDVVEFEALRGVYEAAGAPVQGCALGSVKTQIGHTKAAAGAAGLIKAVLALHHKVLPPTLKVSAPIPGLDLGTSPFYLPTVARPWIAQAGRPRRAAVSSFGFGGTNFHVAVEEYRGASARPARMRAVPTELILLHAQDPAGLAAACRGAIDEAAREGTLAHIAKRSQLAFDAKANTRLAVVARDEADLRDQLGAAVKRLEGGDGAPFSTPRGLHVGRGASAGPVALLFPGQGSQSVRMGADLAIHFEEARRVWDEAADVVSAGPTRLADVVFPSPAFTEEGARAQEACLTATEWAQPAIAVASIAALRVLERARLEPVCVAGHSLGELSALSAAGVFDLGCLARAARRRGELMAAASAGRRGAMLAVAAGRARVQDMISAWRLDLVVANHNAPDQTVIAGAEEAIGDAERRLAEERIGARRLPVATAFHSPHVEAACAPFRRLLDDLPVASPRVPVFANATARTFPAHADAVRDAVAGAIAEPVRFADEVAAMYEAGARIFLEVGPGSVLSKLVARCLEGRPHLAVSVDQPGKHGVTALWEALGRLAVAGVPLAFAPLWEGVALEPDPSQKEPSKLTVRLSGANYGKPYPPPSGEFPPAPRPPAPRTAESRAPARAPDLAPHGDAAPRTPPPSAPAAVAAMPAPVVAPIAAADAETWVRAVERLQEPAIQAQKEFQRVLAESHQAFLRALEVSYAGIGQALGTAPAMSAASPPLVMHAPAPPPIAPAEMDTQPTAPPSVARDTPRASPSLDSNALAALLVRIVSEKTGYPTETIDLTMDLEADLGIDSIKRVEILAAVRDRIPGIPQVDTARLGKLRTLRAVLDELGEPSTPTEPRLEATTVQIPPKGAADAAVTPRTTADLTPLVLAIVAEKTGYPAETVELTMDLEADLGIDSIKRVEILSALRERAPGLPEVETARLAKLRTLEEILAFVSRPSTAATNGAAPANPPTAAAPSGVAAENAMRAVVRPAPAPSPGLAMPGLYGRGSVQVLPAGSRVAHAIARGLSERGIAATVADRVAPDARVVVFLGGLGEVSSVDDAARAQREAFDIVRAASHTLKDGGAFVCVQDTGGDFGLSGECGARAWLGGLGALAKTAAREWPRACVRAIDVERGERSDEELADAIVSELLTGGSEEEIGLRASGARVRPVLGEAPTNATRAPAQGAHFVVTGGARGVTAACVLELARRWRPRLLLLGRTPIAEEPAAFRGVVGDSELKRVATSEAKRRGNGTSPREIGRVVDAISAGREIAQTLRELEAMGVSARYASVDVRDGAALSRALDESRAAWGPIRALVHGAGVIADGLLENRVDMAAFDRVFGTKVTALGTLLDATAHDPLEWLCLFSSVAARAGNAGQADYAMANEVLNKVAAVEARRRGDRCRVVSIGWGPWDGGMVGPTLRGHFAARGVPLLPIDAGARAFERELRAEGGTEVIVGPRLVEARAPMRAEVLVDRATYPQLTSHRIHGVVVLPVVIVVEWFARAIRVVAPEGRALKLRDLRVVRGVQLTGYDGDGDVFTVVASLREGARSLSLELLDRDGARRYSATADLDEPGHEDVASFAADDDEPVSAPFQGDAYGPDALFHGPDFQVLGRVETFAERGARAALATAIDTGWPTETWCTDPAALDGALQLASLYSLARGIGQTLPLRIERVAYHGVDATGNLRCDLRVRDVSRERGIFDLQLAREDGTPMATLHGVEMYVVPSGTAGGA